MHLVNLNKQFNSLTIFILIDTLTKIMEYDSMEIQTKEMKLKPYKYN